MAFLALGGVALSAFLQEAIITGGLPELHSAREALFVGQLVLLVVLGWSVGKPWALGACLAPPLAALAYLALSGQALSLTGAKVIPLYLAMTAGGVLASRLYLDAVVVEGRRRPEAG